MRLLHELAKIHATFDDPHLVSQAGLVPVMALAQRAGLGKLGVETARALRDRGLQEVRTDPDLAVLRMTEMPIRVSLPRNVPHFGVSGLRGVRA